MALKQINVYSTCMYAYEHATHEVFRSQRVAKNDKIQLEAVVIHVRVWGRERECMHICKSVTMEISVHVCCVYAVECVTVWASDLLTYSRPTKWESLSNLHYHFGISFTFILLKCLNKIAPFDLILMALF